MQRPRINYTRQTNANRTNRRPEGSSRSAASKTSKMTPGIAAVIAVIIVCAVCIPLIIASINNTSNISSDNIITAEQLGYTVVTPLKDELEITENTAAPTDTESPGVLYEKGHTDDHIKEIQLRLMALGYMVEAEPTTLFGPATEEAVKLFQTKHELNSDGKVNESTYNKLFSDNAQVYTSSVGSSGSDVATIQSLLSKLGYFSGSSTGYFGTETEAAVKKFQTANGLTADGKVGINTLSILKSSNAVAYTPPSPSPSATDQA